MNVWFWIVGGLAVWLGVAALVAVIFGRGVRLADERSFGTGASSTPSAPAGSRVTGGAAVRRRRRAVPLPTVGLVLMVIALGLETAGFVTQLTGVRGTVAVALSMDGPHSIPRLFVAAVFAAAALAAVAGAVADPARRSWWLAVGLVAGLIAAIKAGNTVHSSAMTAVSEVLGRPTAVLLTAVLAALVLGGLWWLSRHDRRDRRRVLGALSLYAVGSVALSAVAEGIGDELWTLTATFVEESFEAVGGVAYLLAVLVGVAPHLVLPRAWPLRRQTDVLAKEQTDQLLGAAARTELPRHG